MDRTGLTDAQVLAALYNSAQPLGRGFLHYKPGDMTVEEAEKELGTGDDVTQMFNKPVSRYFDYLHGRVLKVDVSKNPLSLELYNRDNGSGAGEAAVRDAGLI